MSYTDADVQAAQEAVDRLYSDGEPHDYDEEIEAILGATAPAIAARALREAADLPDPTGQWQRACSPLARQVLCDRADEIEVVP